MRIATAAVFASCVLAAALAARQTPEDDKDLAKLAGTWKVVSTGGHGKVVKADGNTAHGGAPLWSGTTFTIKGDKLTTKEEPVVLPEAKPEAGLYFAVYQHTKDYRLKTAKGKEKGPAAIDLVVGKGVVLKGIYELKGDELKLCAVNWLALAGEDDQAKAKSADGKARPGDFKTKAGGEYVSFVLKRNRP
jgi:uncharacterized protein (TIGR03067 family)